ncbi:hypothetical protein [Arthrobacter sp. NyZ413]|uniref:hypothetical protein n=1 Tax=Arthrobacter sp. NyZ413 TaxID=3144669 RepID=UPI003BF90BE3
MAELQVEAIYTLRITNTTPGASLTFEPSSEWPATFGLYALWESPNALCDKAFGEGLKGFWCGVELAHFHIDQAVAPGASIDLVSHPGVSDWFQADAGTVVPDASKVLAVRDAFARPHDFLVTYYGVDESRFGGSCSNTNPGSPPPSEMRQGRATGTMQIASRSGTCRPFMDDSLFPDIENYLSADATYTILD